MTKAEKKTFIRTLCNSLCGAAIERIDRMPEEWDGHELRLYLSQLFCDEVSSLMTADRSRRRKYQNTIIVNNL